MANYQLSHLAITVSEIDKTKIFYQTIGFTVSKDIYSENTKRHFLLLQGYGMEIEVFYFEDQPVDQKIVSNMKLIGLQHMAFPVKNVQDKRVELMRNGVSLLKDINTSSLGVKNLNIVDPSGIIIEFFEMGNE